MFDFFTDLFSKKSKNLLPRIYDYRPTWKVKLSEFQNKGRVAFDSMVRLREGDSIILPTDEGLTIFRLDKLKPVKDKEGFWSLHANVSIVDTKRCRTCKNLYDAEENIKCPKCGVV